MVGKKLITGLFIAWDLIFAENHDLLQGIDQFEKFEYTIS